MSIRPPRPARPKRNTDEWREGATVAVVSTALVVFGLRVLLAFLGVHTWTAAWKVVAVPSAIVIAPLEQLSPMRRTLVGHLSIAELLSFFVVSAVAVVVLSSLANRRR